MKVLWFTNLLLPPACEYLGIQVSKGGGWMEELRANLEMLFPEIELHIASFSNIHFKPFTINNSTYYPILIKNSSKFVKMRERWKHTKFAENQLKRCNNLVTECNPDLIHVHGTENLFGLVQEYTTIPVVISLQGILTHYSKLFMRNIGIRGFNREIFSKQFLRGEGELHSWRTQSNMAVIERRVLKQAKYVIGRSQWDMEFCILLNKNVHYFRSPFIVKKIFQISKQWEFDKSSSFRVFALANPSLRKGWKYLFEAISILNELREEEVKLVIGGGVQSNSMIRYQIKKSGVSKFIEFLGPMSSQQIVAQLLKASAYAFPSHIDNSPNSLAEAMTVGIPCVATYSGGEPLIKQEETGLLVRDGDSYSLASALNRLLTDKNLATKLGLNARRKALVHHEAASITNGIIEIYKEIVENSFNF